MFKNVVDYWLEFYFASLMKYIEYVFYLKKFKRPYSYKPPLREVEKEVVKFLDTFSGYEVPSNSNLTQIILMDDSNIDLIIDRVLQEINNRLK